MKTLVITPTYNEKGNIGSLVDEILSHTKGFDVSILVVDSHSPDGTGQIADQLAREHPQVHVLHQSGKLGLGKAYLDGFTWAFQRDFDAIVTMDADFSHPPSAIPEMIRQMDRFDLVIGSRYVQGGELVNWPWTRKLISGFGNWYARTIIGVGLHDLTNGFHCFRRTLLEKILEPAPKSEGYVFLIELKFRSLMLKARHLEIPIVFANRTQGKSKISRRIILEAAFRVWELAAQKRYLNRKSPAS